MKSTYIKVIVIVLVWGIFLTSCSDNQPESVSLQPVVVKLSQPTPQTNNGIQMSGQLRATETAVISTRVMGFIHSLYVKPGDVVNKGQLLITIRNDDMLAKKAQTQAMVTEAEAALADAHKDMERYTELHKQQSASDKELENIALRYQSMKSKTETARQMQHEVEAMLAYTQLVAPFSGVVTQTMTEAGNMANPGSPLLIVENKSGYEVIASVTETDIQYVHLNALATVFIKSIGKTITGTITEVSPSSTYSGGRYSIKVLIPQTQNDGLYAGMSTRVSVAGSNTTTGLWVPASALVHKDQLTGIYTVSRHNTAMLRWLRLGKTEQHQVEILSGLNPNESFIMEASGRLYNGAPVQVKSN